MAWVNINSLPYHLDELKVFMLDSKIDILAINETKLNDNIIDEKVKLPGYETVRKDRTVNGRIGGGVCIYLREEYQYRERDDLSHVNLEWLTVEVTKPGAKPILISTWYRPPKSSSDLMCLKS